MTSPREILAPPQSAVDAIQRLARVLDRIGDALAVIDTQALLAVEGELDSALAAISAKMSAKMSAAATVGDRAAALVAGEQAAAALARCRRLGLSFSNVAGLLDQAGRIPDGYDRGGAYIKRVRPVSVLVSI